MSESTNTATNDTQPAARKLRFGLAYAQVDNDRATATDPSRRGYETHWAETLDHIVWAESIGFDSIWISEHHGEEDTKTKQAEPPYFPKEILNQKRLLKLAWPYDDRIYTFF